jgi:uncharacterized protein (DUF58 family)
VIQSLWRRLGVSPFALVFAGLACIAMLLSRGAGSGWLVVVAAAYLGVLVVAGLWAVIGMIGVAVELHAPSDAVVGETYAVDVCVHALVPQLRTVTFTNLDGSTHLVEGARPVRVAVQATRRSLLPSLRVEVRGGLPLGLFRFARVRTVALETPLAIAPTPVAVSLLDALGEDAAAEVRGVRPYVPGDAARLVHWRSTARRGELMVREMESAELLRGASLVVRLSLPDDSDRAEALASEAAGLAIAALDGGLTVVLATREASGPASGAVVSRRAAGRRLAAAVPGAAPAVDTAGERRHVVELPR